MEAPVRWGIRAVGVKRGRLTLEDQFVTLESANDVEFHVPIGDLRSARWPWYGLDTAFLLDLNGKRYRVSFVPVGASFEEWSDGLKTGAVWKQAISGSAARVSSRWRGFAVSALRIVTRSCLILLGVFCVLLGLVLVFDPGSSILLRVFGGLGIVYWIGQGLVALQEMRRRRRAT